MGGTMTRVAPGAFEGETVSIMTILLDFMSVTHRVD
jgi:hypothetical protein